MQRSGAGGKPTVSDYAFHAHTSCILQGHFYPALSGFKANTPGYYHNILILFILDNGMHVAIWIIVNVINMFRLGMGAYANRRKFVTGFENAPGQTINIVQAQNIKGFVGVYPLGLHCSHGCEYGAVDEGHITVSVDRIRTHAQTD
jgi:hypothetical protein